MRLSGALIAGLASLMLGAAIAVPARWHWDLPRGVAPPPVPADNAMSAAKVALGRRLFYDADLSIDGTIACATCHEQHRAFAEGNPTHPGVHGTPGRRNVPGLANAAWASSLTWGDPRIKRLEAQVLVPVSGTHPVEMGMAGKEDEIAHRLGRDDCYVSMFAAAFPSSSGRIDMSNIARALASFERTIVSFDSPYDAWKRGDRTAISYGATHGAAVFGASCAACHSGPLLSDGGFHAILPPNAEDRGLGEATDRAADDNRFRTPSLRNVALTAPYFHDGSAKTLAEAIRRHPQRSAIADADMADLIAFLDALTDPHLTANTALSLPDTACGKRL